MRCPKHLPDSGSKLPFAPNLLAAWNSNSITPLYLPRRPILYHVFIDSNLPVHLGLPPRQHRSAVLRRGSTAQGGHKAHGRTTCLHCKVSLTASPINSVCSIGMLIESSKSQYEATFKRWKIRKNLSAEEWRFVHERVEKRKRQGKDESVVLVEETLIPAKKVRKELCRHFPPTLTQGSYSGEFHHHNACSLHLETDSCRI